MNYIGKTESKVLRTVKYEKFFTMKWQRELMRTYKSLEEIKDKRRHERIGKVPYITKNMFLRFQFSN